MRILVVSNFYPPHFVGGYEWGCYGVVQALRSKGHDVYVLTSTYGVERKCARDRIYRLLEADLMWGPQKSFSRFIKLLGQEIKNAAAFLFLAKYSHPDIVYIWNLTHVSVSIALRAQRMGFRLCYYVFDNWLAHWEKDPWYAFWNRNTPVVFKRLRSFLSLSPLRSLILAPLWGSLGIEYVQFASHYLERKARENGKRPKHPTVIHWGVDPGRFPYNKSSRKPERLLYVGQVVEHKGVHTAIEALKRILDKGKTHHTTLTIAGGTITPEYELSLRRLVHTLGLEKNVRFLGFVSPEALPSLYNEHDILVFPSVWEEPFGIVLLEGMASGLAVVATGTGGSAEILDDEANALIFPPGRSDLCAKQIIRLLDYPALFETLRSKGRQTVESRFNFRRTVERISESLREAI
jgi:glycosyltransferase involved in cell wall biosynthesis